MADDFYSAICRALAEMPPLPWATLSLDGLPLSTGQAILELDQKIGSFHPRDGNTLDTVPESGAILTMSDTGDELRLERFHRCPLGDVHYHFSIAN